MIPDDYMDKNTSIAVDYLKKKTILPEETNKIHYHSRHEFVIINKGLATYATNEGAIKISDMSIVFMPAHTLHNPFIKNSTVYERYRIKFTDDFAKGILARPQLLDESLKKPFIKQLNKDDFDEIYSTAEQLYKFSNKDNKTDVDKLDECIHLSMLILKSKNARSVQIPPYESYINEVFQYIKDNYKNPLTIQTVAEQFFVSKSKLIYDFNNYCRISILEYITITRIEAAKKYLLKGWSVTATSEACGFSTPSYFIKVFSKIIGLTPLKFQLRYIVKEKDYPL